MSLESGKQGKCESYIPRIKEDFLDKSMSQTWEIVEKRTYGEYHTLVHPCSMNQKLLDELIPRSFKVDEVLELLPIKQKQIARRLNISMLPSDRPSGMLGQTALFEILRNKGYDFKTYVDGFYENRHRAHFEGHALLFILGYIYYIRRFFGYTPIDLVQYLVEPITRYQLAVSWDANWVTRIRTNIVSVSPSVVSNKKIHQILRELVRLQDGWGATASRVMKWTGVPRTDAAHLVNILRSTRIEHRYRIVSKNTSTAKVLSKSQSPSSIRPSLYSSCTSLTDNEDYFISVNDVFKRDTDGKCFEMEAFGTNVELYDLKEQVWRLSPTPHVTRSVDDIYALLQNGDNTIPDNDIQPTRRDIVFIALLTGMDTGHYPDKKQRIIKWFTKGYGIPKEEVEKGVRNVLRKNMLRNQYTHFGIMDLDREFFAITFDDRSKRVIPFLGEVLPNLPFFLFQTDIEMGYGHIFEFHPSYLSCDVRKLIESSMKEHGINGEMFVVRSWGFGHPGSILQLVSDE